jgi:hypothetical protein
MSSVTYGGTLEVANVGGTLALGNTFTLFQATAYSGSFSSYSLPALPAGFNWDVSQLGVNGTLTIVSASASPVINGGGSWSNGVFTLNFGGANGQSYGVLMSTNLLLPLSQWTRIASGTFGISAVTYMNMSATNMQQFYRIVSP